MPKSYYGEVRCMYCGNIVCTCDDDVNPGFRRPEEIEEDNGPTEQERKDEWDKDHQTTVYEKSVKSNK